MCIHSHNQCVYKNVCMSAYVCVFMFIYIYVYIYIYIRVCVRMCACMCMYVYIYIYMYIYLCIYRAAHKNSAWGESLSSALSLRAAGPARSNFVPSLEYKAI